ncbi:hypothetical protein Tco_0331390 [Tanacetum coccineum]
MLNQEATPLLRVALNYDSEIRVSPRKENVVQMLEQKERIKPLRARALVIPIIMDLPKTKSKCSTEAQKQRNLQN